MNTIEAVVFDLGRVLVDVDFSNLFATYLGQNSFDEKHFNLDEIIKNDWFRGFSCGKTDPQTFYKKVTAHFGIRISYNDFVDEWCSVFKPLTGMDGLLQKVSAQLPVTLLSDTDILHWKYLLRAYPFLKIFEAPVLSFRIGHLKPSKICYQKAAHSVGKPSEKCLFIDDREVNVVGAQKCGMQAVLFTGYENLNTYLSEYLSSLDF